MYKLSDDDARVVDMLLETGSGPRNTRAGGNGNGHASPSGDGNGHTNGAGAFGAAPSHLSERLERVSRLLETLEALPAPEPAGDLLARTLARIEAGPSKRPAAPVAPTQSGTGAQRPHA